MSLVALQELMQDARAHGYAVGYFESWSLESLQGVIDAAEQSRSPIIIGFNGQFLSHSERVVTEDLSLYGALGKAAAEAAKVPCGFIFNECSSDAWVRQAVKAGFNLVMPIASQDEPLQTYTRRMRSMVEFAHAHGVAVEAELGTLPSGETGLLIAGESTNPELAARFVEQTGVDLLAVSVGNFHILLHTQRELNLEHLAAIHAATKIPLVLHGGTGIGSDSLKAAIGLGVCKVNYGTYLKQHYLKCLRQALGNSLANPHQLLGYGGAEDILVMGRQAVRDAVLERIGLLNCMGRA